MNSKVLSIKIDVPDRANLVQLITSSRFKTSLSCQVPKFMSKRNPSGNNQTTKTKNTIRKPNPSAEFLETNTKCRISRNLNQVLVIK